MIRIIIAFDEYQKAKTDNLKQLIADKLISDFCEYGSLNKNKGLSKNWTIINNFRNKIAVHKYERNTNKIYSNTEQLDTIKPITNSIILDLLTDVREQYDQLTDELIKKYSKYEPNYFLAILIMSNDLFVKIKNNQIKYSDVQINPRS